MTLIRAVVVAIPVHDEEELLGRCLDSVEAARVPPGVAKFVVVALDSCTDRSAEVARRPGVSTVAGAFGAVGAARSAAVDHGLALTGFDPASVWIANTDGDSSVEPGWLLTHLALAEEGAHVVRGAVAPDPADLDEALLARFWAEHTSDDDHPYLYGANLGVRGDAYAALGGFADLRVHEDRELAERAYAAGLTVVSTARCPVLTSGRRAGRARGGFADYLATLATRRD